MLLLPRRGCRRHTHSVKALVNSKLRRRKRNPNVRGRVSFPVRWEFQSVPVAPPAGCSLLPRNSEVARLGACELEIINWKSEAKNFLTWTSARYKRSCARGQSERVYELGVLDRGDYRRHSSACAACACALTGVCVWCLVVCCSRSCWRSCSHHLSNHRNLRLGSKAPCRRRLSRRRVVRRRRGVEGAVSKARRRRFARS